MATFLPQVQIVLPQLETFTPDYKFLQDVLETRQDRYTTNYNALNDLYGKIVYADLSRDDNKQIRDQFSKSLTPKLEQISGLDLSLQQNVNTAKGLFAPFYEDKAMVKDIYFTKQYGRQMQYAQNLLNSSDEKERFKYSDWGVKDLQYQMQDFKSDSREASINRANPTFTNNVNLVDMGVNALKEMGMSIKKTTSDGKWLITQKNGSLLTNQLVGYEQGEDGKPDPKKPIYASPAMEYLQERLIHDPAVARAYYVKNKTLARMQAEGTTQQYGSFEKAQEAWAKGVLEKYGMEIPKEIARVNSMLQTKTKQTKSWEDYKKENGIIPGSPEEDMLLKSQTEAELLNNAVELKNKTAKDVGGPAANLQVLLEKAYRAEAAMQMNGDMAKAAIAYSNIDYEETRVADPFALKKLDHHYSILKQKHKHLLDKELERYKKSLDGGTDGLNFFAPGGDPNAATVKQDQKMVEQRQQFEVIKRYTEQYRDAEQNLLARKMLFTEQVYNNLDSFNEQLRTTDGESVLSSNGMINYKRAVTDKNGAVVRYENVTKTWKDAMSDFTGMNAWHNRTEAERLFESAYKAAYSRDFDNDDLDVNIPTNAELWRKDSPALQDAFNNQRKTILAYQARMVQADRRFNASLLAAYNKWNAEADQREGGFREGAKWNDGWLQSDERKYNKTLDKIEQAFLDDNTKKGNRLLKRLDRKSSDRSEDEWGMFAPILSDSQVEALRSGQLWFDVDKLSGITADDEEATSLRMLSEDEYVQLLTSNIFAQKDEVNRRFNEYLDENGGRGRRFERNDDFLTAKKRWILGLGKMLRSGESDFPTIVGKFWDWDKKANGGKGGMVFDYDKAQNYARSYYKSVMTGLNKTMTSADAANTLHALPSDWQQMFNNTPGDGSGEALQHNVYGFVYDGLSKGSNQSQLAISELNNLFTMFNQLDPGSKDMRIGDHGNEIPSGKLNKRRGKKSRGKDIARGTNEEYNAAKKLLEQIQIDLRVSESTSKGPTPQFEIEYRENIGNSGMGSYTIKLGEAYADKFKGKEDLLGETMSKEFNQSNSITFYFDKGADMSNYKSSNKAFDDIKVLTDINGEFSQEITGGGKYWFTQNSAGQYMANVILHKFDPSTGAMVLDQETKQQIMIDPNVTNMTNLSNQLDNHLRQTAEFNMSDQNIYKQNYTGQ